MDTSRVLRSTAASESYKYLLDVLRELGAFVGVLPMRLLESSEHRRELLAPPVVPRQPPVLYDRVAHGTRRHGGSSAESERAVATKSE